MAKDEKCCFSRCTIKAKIELLVVCNYKVRIALNNLL